MARALLVTAAALGFLCVACLWWVYFDMGIEGGLSPAPGTILKFAYVHIPLLGALTAVGAGVHLLIEEAGEAAVARTVAAGVLVVLAATAEALPPVTFAACSAAALVVLVLYEIRHGLAREVEL